MFDYLLGVGKLEGVVQIGGVVKLEEIRYMYSMYGCIELNCIALICKFVHEDLAPRARVRLGSERPVKTPEISLM